MAFRDVGAMECERIAHRSGSDLVPCGKRQDLNTPLEFSRHRVDILPHLVVSFVSEHCPDDTDQVTAKSTDRLVVGLAFSALAIVVRFGLWCTADVVSHGSHHRRFGTTIDLTRALCSRHLA